MRQHEPSTPANEELDGQQRPVAGQPRRACEDCPAPAGPEEASAAPIEPAPEQAPPRAGPGPVRRRGGLTDDGRLRSGRLAGMTMNRAIWVVGWPILAESLLNSLVGFTDTRLAAELGAAETDAIGGAAYIYWFISLAIMAIGVGTTALVSRAVGRGRLAVANAAVGQTMILQVLTGIGVALLITLAAGPTARLLNMEAAATDSFEHYLRALAPGIPFMAILFGGIACLRGAGDSFRPLLVMVVVNAVNIGVSFALVGRDLTRAELVEGRLVTHTLLANPFPFDFGVIGIALGTLAAHLVGAVLILALLRDGRSGVALRARRLRPHRTTMWRLVRLGLPNFLETFGLWFGNFFVLLMVGSLGPGMLGSHIVAIRAEAFSFLGGFALGMAAATLAGQYLGAGSPELARKAVWRCTYVAAAFMGCFGFVYIFFPRTVTGLLSAQPVHLEQTPPLLIACGIVQIPFALALVFRSALRGAGDVRVVMAMTWVTTYAIRIPAAYILSGVDVQLPQWLGGGVIENPGPFEPSLLGLWIGLCAELLLRGAVFTFRFVGGGWTRVRV